MEPQRSLKIIGKNTEYTQTNHKDLDKILKDRSGSLVRLLKILNSKDLLKSLKILEVLVLVFLQGLRLIVLLFFLS